MSLAFFKSYLDQPEVDWASMPLKLKDRIALGVWLCRQNGPVPGDFLQVGMMILRKLDLEKLPDGETPPFWSFVGFLEWISCRSPDKEAYEPLLTDLAQMYPRTPHTTELLYKRIEGRFPHLSLPIMRMRIKH